MKPLFDNLSATRLGVAVILTPALTSSVQAAPTIQVEQHKSSALADKPLMNELEKLEKELALSYFSRSPFIEVETSENEEAPLWSSLEAGAIGLCAPLETVTVKATVGEVRQGQPRAVASDDLDWEFLDFE